MSDIVFSAVRMPSSPFIQVGKFAPISGGDIYIGKPDTNPKDPANQVQVYLENEDLTLVPVPQPIKINQSGYPEYNGIVGRFVTQTASSMDVYDRNDVLQYSFDNLLEYDAAQMWKVIGSSTGWEYVGTPEGTLKTKLQGFVTPFDFVGREEYTSVSQAIQAMFDYAKTNAKIINAYGWKGTLESTVTADSVTILGGTWQGTADFRVVGTKLDGAVINNLRIMLWGGDNRIRDCLFDGKPTNSKVGSIVSQGAPAGGTYEITECEFRNGLFGILQQGTGEKITRGVLRNLSFYDMGGDCIELNVINEHYDNGCVIDGIFMDNIDGLTPIANSSWGIGIGIAGKGPYGWDAPDTQYAKNIAIRNVFANRVRQIVHLEVARDCTVENIHGDPNQNVSNGTGLTMATVVCYGCKRITIDGVYGEPVVTSGTAADSVRVVMLEWGVTAGAPSNPCFDMTVRNVHSKTGRFYAGVAAGNGYRNTYTIENVDVSKFSVFGVGSLLSMSNVRCQTFDAIGDDSAGGTTSDGYVATGKTILRMVNVTAYDVNGYGDQGWSRCSYSEIESIGSNVYARPYPRQGIDGGIGAKMIASNRTYIIPSPADMNATGIWDGNAFPTGREFMEGDLVVRNDGKIFTVVTSGSYIPAIDEFKIKATTVGSKVIASNYPLGGNKSDMVWIYKTPLSPGCRIVIPGAGEGGGALSTWITRGPYRVNVNDPTSEIRIEIAHAVQTATADGAQLAAAKVVSYRTPT
nr:MAG: Head binding protein [Bacteriophage sp.]